MALDSFTGRELLRVWEAGKENGLTQRKLARFLGIGFNSLHGKIFREQQDHKVRQTVSFYRESLSPVLLKAAVFDIETTDFAAGGVQDHMVCMSVLPLDADKPVTYSMRFDDLRDDRRLLTEAREALEQFDILIGHNIAAYDFNWLHSRFMYHDLQTFGKRFFYYDTYQASRRMAIRAERKSLGFLIDFYRVPGVKTSVLPVAWSMVDSPNEEEFDAAMSEIVYHCEQDVIANRNIFDVMFPLDRGMLNLPLTKKW